MESKKLRTIYPKNHENFKNNKPRVLLLYKKSVQLYVNVWLFDKKISYEFIGIYRGQQKLSCLGIEFEITLTDGGELKFDKSFLHYNIKKKIYPKASLNLNVNIEY